MKPDNDYPRMIVNKAMHGEVEANGFAIVVANESGAPVPNEIQIIPYGSHQTLKGPFTCDEESQALVMNAFASRHGDMVIDFEHQSILDPPVEAPAAGWIKRLINKGKEGIWAAVEWTEKARQYIANKEYRYISPVWLQRASDNKVIYLFNAALTNTPNITSMVPIVNSALRPDQVGTDLEAVVNNAIKDRKIKPSQRAWALDYARKDPASFVVFLEKAPSIPEIPKGLLSNSFQGSDLNGRPVTITDEEMASRRAAFGQAVLQSEINAACGVDEETFEKYRPDRQRSGDPAGGEPDQVQALINKLCGVDEETFRKYSPDAVNRANKATAGDGEIDETQRMINALFGIDDATYKKYGPHKKGR